MKLIKLARRDRIIAVVPERCGGPGWSNEVVWVYVINANGSLRTECLQTNDRSNEMHALFTAGAAMAEALVDAVRVERIDEKAG